MPKIALDVTSESRYNNDGRSLEVTFVFRVRANWDEILPSILGVILKILSALCAK